MPSLLTHSLVGLAAGKVVTMQKMPTKFWLLSAICPILPDVDVLGLFFGIPYDHFFGHRGFFHSIFFALIVSNFIVHSFFREEEKLSKRWFVFILYFFVVTSTHGLFDAFTSGGLGIALLSPFDNTRYFFPVTPITVSPLGFHAFFSGWGLRVIQSEFIYVWSPAILLLIIVQVIKTKRNKNIDSR